MDHSCRGLRNKELKEHEGMKGGTVAEFESLRVKLNISIDHAPHTVVDIEPGEPMNISNLFPLELTHASPHSF